VESHAREQQQWVVQPLIDAGLALDQVRDLVVSLAFADIVSEGRGTLAWLGEAVVDQPAAVRTAWRLTIARMFTLDLLP
jgi:hypothetical protein